MAAPAGEPAKASWREASGREQGPGGYQFGDLSRSLVRSAKGAAERTRTRWREAQNIERQVEAPQPVLSTVVRGAGQIFGASKGLVAGATIGVVKGGVALSDKFYEASSSKVVSEVDRERFHSRLAFAARGAAAEIAPLVGRMASSFMEGAMEGSELAQRGLHSAYEKVRSIRMMTADDHT